MSDTKLYLLDVEGTVAPVTLTGEVLFPYARRHFEEFLREGLVREMENLKPEDSPEGMIMLDVAGLMQENQAEADSDAPWILSHDGAAMNPANAIPRILAYVYWLMDRDRKSTALKSLQGKIWKAGFESGELKGTLFDDVPGAFERWACAGSVAIYSSGSVEAQRLLFRYSSFGDLSGLISGYFDTRIGAKRERASYAAIAAEMKVAPGEVLFFSDVVAELDAARDSGCGTRLVVREGNAPVADAHGHERIESFENL
ncbi:acireductone synthase [Terracidiphilus gabretensis]|jgi:enolase-phosphatase E1|uniref:acireductone synthase n=1 Tax=Terracidiphilus gabretensis TaxID=1577687 RepID=UPI00071B606B|nr:acireductone synthase [Terracidiphilus gabretensis]